MNIDEGLPSSRAAWPDGLLALLETLKQGDVVSSLPMTYVADPKFAVWDRTKDYEGSGSIVILSHPDDQPAYWMVTTQTCDIVESAKGRPAFPWIQAAPVFNMQEHLNSGERKLVRKRGFNQYFWFLPGLPDGFWVADLRLEIAIEKSSLQSCSTLSGHLDELDRRNLGRRLASRRTRPAFSDDFCRKIQGPLADSLKTLRSQDPELFALMDPDVEVLVRLDDHLAPTVAQIALLSDGSIPTSVAEWFQTWWDDAVADAKQVGIELLPVANYAAEDMSVREFRSYTRLPLDRVSPN